MDQRNDRKMTIGSLDQVTTKRWERNATRTAQHDKYINQNIDTSYASSLPHNKFRNQGDVDDSSFTSITSEPGTSSNQMRVKLPNIACMSDRYKLSDRAAAAMASATLVDFGVIKSNNTTNVIDRSKIRRERSNYRKNLQSIHPELIESIYFDGRKDQTLVQNKIGGKYHQSTVLEEHYVLLQEPNSEYLGHITPFSGSSENICKEIINFFSLKNISMDNLTVIGCDGTNVNTGVNAGVIKKLESHLQKPLQWFICMLHFNELPFRHLMQYIDGHTTGPKGFSGIIGKAIQSCEFLSVCHYNRIELPDLPNIGKLSDLSTDQQLLLELCNAISQGICSVDLASRKPGPISHARWLTTAIRILRLYIGTIKPSDKLVDLTTYIIKVYAPVWFSIKTNSSCINGPKHILNMIKLSRYLPVDQRKIVDEVIQRNSYFAHHENILIAMMADSRDNIRELAYRRILAVRSKDSIPNVRAFKVPIIKFEANDYIDLIDWNLCARSEPPLTKLIDLQDLKDMLSFRNFPSIDFLNFPCHTQSVERHIRLVTEASKSVYGQDRRDGLIKSCLKSRSIMPSFETKSEFKFET